MKIEPRINKALASSDAASALSKHGSGSDLTFGGTVGDPGAETTDAIDMTGLRASRGEDEVTSSSDAVDMTGLRAARAEDEASGTALYPSSDAEAHDGAGGGFSNDAFLTSDEAGRDAAQAVTAGEARDAGELLNFGGGSAALPDDVISTGGSLPGDDTNGAEILP